MNKITRRAAILTPILALLAWAFGWKPKTIIQRRRRVLRAEKRGNAWYGKSDDRTYGPAKSPFALFKLARDTDPELFAFTIPWSEIKQADLKKSQPKLRNY